MFVNNKISKEEGQREAWPSDNIFNFVVADENVSVETEAGEICESKFKSSTNLKKHDQRLPLKKGTDNAFKCDFCNEIFAEKS